MVKFPLIFKQKLHLLLFFLLSCYTAFSSYINAPVTDTFHEGEYLGSLWHMKAYYNGLARFPLLVHGGMDYIPSVIAEYIFGPNAVIVGTRIMLLIISSIYYFLFLDICHLLIKEQNRNWIWTTALVILFYYFAPHLNSSVIDVAYFPIRDVFLFLTIWCFMRSVKTKGLKASIFSVIGSVSTAFAFFWCYNRGVMTIAFFAFVMFGLYIKNRCFVSIILSVGSALLCLALLDAAMIFGTFKENSLNIIYWLTNEAKINTGPSALKDLPGYLGFIVLTIFALSTFFTLWRARHKIKNDNINLFVVTASLGIIQLLLIKINYHGGGSLYAFNSGWPSIFVLFYLGSRLLRVSIKTSISALENTEFFPCSEIRGSIRLFKLSVKAFLVFMVIASPSIFYYSRFVKKLIVPCPDKQLVSIDMLYLRDIFSKYNNYRYFNWTNDGVIALITKNIYCTDYSYVHYASADHELNMLNQLKVASPNLIVYDSKNGSVELDNIYMSSRFPLVDKYIRENYRNKISVGTYTIVTKNNLSNRF